MSKCTSSPVPWQVLGLVSNHLDPKTLAIASCVCKTWSISMSCDQIWQPLCSTTYPSLSTLRSTDPSLTYRRLYALGYVSKKRRLKPPSKLNLSLHDLIFSLNIYNDVSCIVSVVVPGNQLCADKGVFRFDVDVENGHLGRFEGLGELRVTWEVVLEGYKGVFTMMDCKKGKGRFVLGLEGWFTEELPAPGCCSSDAVSGLVADLRLGLRDEGGKAVVERIGVGVLSIVSWRYLLVEDALRYLQHFLLPCV